MREIKFRAWCKSEDRMLDGYQITPHISLKYDEDWSIENLMDNTTILNDDLILMQFTGLKDKNGKEIYEGDIVNDCCSKELRTVLYQAPQFSLDRPRKIGHSNLHENCEVIGNIYQNPELLK